MEKLDSELLASMFNETLSSNVLRPAHEWNASAFGLSTTKKTQTTG